MEKYFALRWRYLTLIRQDIVKMNKDNIGYPFKEYVTMVSTLQQVPLQTMEQFLVHIFDLLENETKIPCPIKITKKEGLQLLTGNIMSRFPEETNCHDATVLYYSKHIGQLLTTLLKLKPKDRIPIKTILQLSQVFLEFSKTYSKWEKREKEKNIEDISQMFWSSCAQITYLYHQGQQELEALQKQKKELEKEYMNSSDMKELDGVTQRVCLLDNQIQEKQSTMEKWKQQYDNGFQELKAKVIQQVRYINGQCGVNYFHNIIPVFLDPSFNDNIKNLVHQAFWSVLESDLDETPPKYDKLLQLFKELKIYMMACVPSRTDIHQQIDEAIDIDLWKQMLEHEAHNNDDIVKVIAYIYRKLHSWCKAEDIEKITEWKNQWDTDLEKVFQGQQPFSKFISGFLKQVFPQLEAIIEESKQFKTTQEYRELRDRLMEIHQSKTK